MHIRTYHHRYWLILVLIMLMGSVVLPAYAQNTSTNIIYGAAINTSQLPVIEYVFNLVGTGNIADQTFTKADISLNLNDDPAVLLPIGELTKRNIPLSVAFVLDSSVMMNEVNTPPNYTRYQDAVDTINTLLRKLPDGSQWSLITFDNEINVAVSQEVDKNVIRNALVSVQRSDVVAEEYALTAGIKQGLIELQNQPYNPLAVFVLTAGKADISIDEREINSVLSEMADNPPLITVIEYGSDQVGQYAQYPANLSSLDRSVIGLQAQSLRYFATNRQEYLAISQRLDEQITALVRNTVYYVVRFSARELKLGQNRFTLNVGDTISTRKLEVAAAPPIINLALPTTLFSSSTALRTTIAFAQQPIEKVEYFFANTRIGESKTANDGYVFNLNTATLTQFAPRKSYELFAAATYLEAGTAKTVRSPVVTVQLAPPVVAPATPTAIPWPLIAGVGAGLVVLVGAGWLLRRVVRRKPVQAAPISSSSPRVSRPLTSMPTIVHMPLAAHDAPTDDFVTGDETEDFTTRKLVAQHKIVLQVDGTTREELLRPYSTTIGRTVGNDIVIPSQQISREHAQISIINGVVYVRDRDSRNGIYLQAQRPSSKDERIPTNQNVPLNLDTPFWIGSDVQASIQHI